MKSRLASEIATAGPLRPSTRVGRPHSCSWPLRAPPAIDASTAHDGAGSRFVGRDLEWDVGAVR